MIIPLYVKRVKLFKYECFTFLQSITQRQKSKNLRIKLVQGILVVLYIPNSTCKTNLVSRKLNLISTHQVCTSLSHYP